MLEYIFVASAAALLGIEDPATSGRLLQIPSQETTACCEAPCKCCLDCECDSVEWNVKVVRVKDGDTVVVQKGTKTHEVRLIGVDTPETVDRKRGVQPYGSEASRHTKETLNGRRIRLEFYGKKTDNFGRMLAVVWLDGVNYNLSLIEDGYGEAYVKYPMDAQLKHSFMAAQQAAMADRRGKWGLD